MIELYRQDDKEIMETGLPKLNYEEVQVQPNGTEKVVLVSKVPFYNEKKEIIGILGIYTDITSKKEQEKLLRQAKEAAEALNNAKTDFIANMSHDIRTPLSGIVGMSQLLMTELTNLKFKQYAQWIQDSGQQLLGLLNGILDVVFVEQMNERDLHIGPFDIKGCIDDIIQLEKPSIQLKNLELRMNIHEDIPSFVYTDGTKLHRVLLNLIGNAVKFTQSGYVSITIYPVAKSEHEVTLHFSIKDTGIGIPILLQEKIFERFYRVTPLTRAFMLVMELV